MTLVKAGGKVQSLQINHSVRSPNIHVHSLIEGLCFSLLQLTLRWNCEVPGGTTWSICSFSSTKNSSLPVPFYLLCPSHLGPGLWWGATDRAGLDWIALFTGAPRSVRDFLLRRERKLPQAMLELMAFLSATRARLKFGQFSFPSSMPQFTSPLSKTTTSTGKPEHKMNKQPSRETEVQDKGEFLKEWHNADVSSKPYGFCANTPRPSHQGTYTMLGPVFPS